MAQDGYPALGWPFTDPYPGTAQSYRRVLQPFGVTKNSAEPQLPGTNPPVYFHTGVDFAVPSDTTLMAAADGKVVAAGPNPTNKGLNGGFGKAVVLDHGSGLMTLYGHMREVDVAVGDTIVRQTAIGASDSTGNSTGPHLHFGVNVAGDPWGLSGWIDPMKCLTADPGTSALPGVSASPGYVTPEQAVWYARQVGIPENQLATCVAIAMAESTLQVAAVSPVAHDGTVGRGLWQIESSHTQYNAARLLSVPAYNAQAMADIYNAESAGQKWHDWTTYGYVGSPPRFVGWGNGAYTAFLNRARQAVAAVPPGHGPNVPIDPHGPTGVFIALPPPLPVEQIPIIPVAIDRSRMVWREGLTGAVGVQIAGKTLPVIDAQWTEPAYRTAGQWQATVALTTVESRDGQAVLDELFKRSKTQAIIRCAYVPNDARPELGRLPPVFTGFASISEINYDQGTLTVDGPDLSGILSDKSATAGSLKAFVNMRVDKAIKKIVTAHNVPGRPGLTVQVDVTAGTVGGVYGANQVQTRTPARTEWDILVGLSEAEGCVCYFRGTTLVVTRVKGRHDAVTLTFRKKGTLLLNPRFRPQPHIKRDFQIQATTYDTVKGGLITKTAGNPDSADVISIWAAPNTPPDRLQKLAKKVLTFYQATELQADLTLARPVLIDPAQPIRIESGSPYQIDRRLMGVDHLYYAVQQTTAYSRDTGFALSLTCTNRVPGIQDDNTVAETSF